MNRQYIRSLDNLFVRLMKWALKIKSPSLMAIGEKGTITLKEAITGKVELKNV